MGGIYLLLLFDHAHRWHKVNMILGFSALTNELICPGMSQDTNSTPLLEDLTLYASGYNPGTQPIVTHFRNAPRLQYVSLHHSMLTEWALPWSQLRSLSLKRAIPSMVEEEETSDEPEFDPEVFLDMLKQCINLQDLRFCIDSVEGLDRAVDPITLPTLLHLDVDFTEADGTFFHTFFSTVRTPKLSSLKISNEFFLDDPWQTSDSIYWSRTPDELRSVFLAFLSHCAESLRKLSLETGVVKEVFTSIVSIANNLTSLRISDTFHSSYFEALTLHFSTDGQDVISGHCPYLSKIDVPVEILYPERSNSKYKTAVFQGLVKMVESRWKVPAGVLSSGKASRIASIGLHPLLLRKMKMEDRECWARLQAIGDEGLVIESIPL